MKHQTIIPYALCTRFCTVAWFCAVACTNDDLKFISPEDSEGSGGERTTSAGSSGSKSAGGMTGRGTGGGSGGTGRDISISIGGNSPADCEGDDCIAIGGQGGESPLPVASAELVYEGSDIRDVTSYQDQLYWIEFGSYDKLKNYQYDGKLLRMPLSGGDPVMLRSDLHGPEYLGVGDPGVFVSVKESVLNTVDGRYEIWRTPEDGSAVEVIQSGYWDHWGEYFEVDGPSVFWKKSGSGIYQYDGSEEPTLIGSGAGNGGFEVTSDYLYRSDNDIIKISRSTDTQTVLSKDGFYYLAVYDGNLLGMESRYLKAMPIDGSKPWTNVKRFDCESGASKIQFVDNNFIYRCSDGYYASSLLDDSPARFVAASSGSLFALTEEGLFYVQLNELLHVNWADLGFQD